MPTAGPRLADRPPDACDLLVVGGGIVGLAVARELAMRHPDAEICVLEREPGLGRHQTGHSSGVVHAGIYYRPGSLRARLCVEGARELYGFCDEHGIPYEKSGKLIIATEEAELARLDELERRGRANEVPGLRRIGADEIAELEPHAQGLAALHSPATGVVDFREVAAAYARDAEAAGVTIVPGCGVDSTRAVGGRIELSHRRGTTTAGFAVLCAGPWSDRLAIAAGVPAAICACAPSGVTWCGPASTRCPIPSSRSSEPTSRAVSTARSCSAPPR
jgi:(S)-2-hydroxyglutarate dehydrogenase